MARKKKEKVVEETTQETKVNEPKNEETKGDVTKVKQKMKMKPMVEKETITKVDLSNPPKTEEDTVQELETEKVDVQEQTESNKEVSEEKQQEEEKEEIVLEEIKEEENKEEDKEEEVEEVLEEPINESTETNENIPENIQKLMKFMEETGGDINDYVKLNQDYSDLDDKSLLKEYYKQTKPHLDLEEIDFLMEDQFSYDEEEDEERDIKRKKLALKEQVAQAKQHLDSAKSKYYEEIKAGSKLTSEQQKAINFFNRYNKDSQEKTKASKQAQSIFTQKTNEVFNDKFKGFEYNVGEKKYRFNVKDVDNIKSTQSDIGNFVKKFLNKKNEMSDAKGYHKSIFTAMNSDAIANHFYEQGKADALKESVAKSKNVNMDPRQQHSGEVEAGGIKVRVLGDNSSDFKFKIKQK
jgi:hypothetical protein|tara:strand:- start:1113 stop:2339 length:1227 start_codon:yes stop_codon:yes gene_type:complete